MSNRVAKVIGIFLVIGGCTSRSEDTSGAREEALTTAAQPAAPVRVAMLSSPNATCDLYYEGNPTNMLHVGSDARGVIEFSVSTTKQDLVLACTDERGVTLPLQRLDDSALVDPTTGVSIATEAAPPIEAVGAVRPALQGDLLAIPQVELAKRGYPFRPNPSTAPNEFAQWKSIVSTPYTRIPVHRIPGAAPAGPLTLATSTTWSGITINKPATVYDVVFSSWVVPNVLLHSTDQVLGNQMAFVWAGLDGGASNEDIAQGGTNSEIIWTGYGQGNCYFSICYTVTYNAWVEWIPDAPSNSIGGLTIHPGDMASVQIYIGDTLQNNDPSGGYMWWQINNITLNTVAAGCLGPRGQADI